MPPPHGLVHCEGETPPGGGESTFDTREQRTETNWTEKSLRLPSHLSPVAVDPLRARARLAGALLAGSTAVLAVVGRVAVLILADHHPPLETAGARAGTLHGGGEGVRDHNLLFFFFFFDFTDSEKPPSEDNTPVKATAAAK